MNKNNLYDEELKKYIQNSNVNNTLAQVNKGESDYMGAQRENYSQPSQNAQPTQSSQPKATSVAPVSQPTQNVQPTQTPKASKPTVQQASTPQYSSQWQSELDNLMSQIMNREKFSFDLNGDAMYQQYADMYKNNADMAMQNAMGQAAAMTGGYGSSYSQAAGQQAYAQQMQGLNNVAMDMYNNALNRYLAEGDALNQQYSMMASREAQDYQRYLDSVAQTNYENEMAYNQSRDEIADAQWRESFDYQKAMNDRNQANWEKELEYQKSQDKLAQENWQNSFDYQKTMDDRNQANWERELAYQQAMDQLAQENWEKQFASSEEQRLYENAYNEALLKYQQERDVAADDKWAQEFAAQQAQIALDNAYRDEAFAYQKTQDQLAQSNWQSSFDYQKAMDAQDQANWQNNFDYQKSQDAQDQANWEASFGYQKDMDKQAQDNWQASFDREGKQWDALYGEGGINNPKFEGNFMYDADGNLREGYTTTNTSYFDENGNFKQATFSRTDEDGNSVWLIDGKEVVRQPGANPYTGSVNPDSKNGTFSNGYQPNNIKGEKLSKTGITDTINGIKQNVWQTPDGLMWIWDGTQNKYLPYVDDEEEKPKATTSTSGGGGGLGKLTTALK